MTLQDRRRTLCAQIKGGGHFGTSSLATQTVHVRLYDQLARQCSTDTITVGWTPRPPPPPPPPVATGGGGGGRASQNIRELSWPRTRGLYPDVYRIPWRTALPSARGGASEARVELLLVPARQERGSLGHLGETLAQPAQVRLEPGPHRLAGGLRAGGVLRLLALVARVLAGGPGGAGLRGQRAQRLAAAHRRHALQRLGLQLLRVAADAAPSHGAAHRLEQAGRRRKRPRIAAATAPASACPRTRRGRSCPSVCRRGRGRSETAQPSDGAWATGKEQGRRHNRLLG